MGWYSQFVIVSRIVCIVRYRYGIVGSQADFNYTNLPPLKVKSTAQEAKCKHPEWFIVQQVGAMHHSRYSPTPAAGYRVNFACVDTLQPEINQIAPTQKTRMKH